MLLNGKLPKMYLFTNNETNWLLNLNSTKNKLCDRTLVEGKVVLGCM